MDDQVVLAAEILFSMSDPAQVAEVSAATADCGGVAPDDNLNGAPSPLSSPEFLLSRRLSKTDVSERHSRVLFWKKEEALLLERPTEGEKAAAEDPNQGLVVTVVDWKGRKYEITLRRWGGANRSLVLTGGSGAWARFVRRNVLQEHDLLEFYTLRRRTGGDGRQNQLAVLLLRVGITAEEEQRRREDWVAGEQDPKRVRDLLNGFRSTGENATALWEVVFDSIVQGKSLA